ncbi:MAG: TonB-dependent receptor [Gammaproteobacteria bacterium]
MQQFGTAKLLLIATTSIVLPGNFVLAQSSPRVLSEVVVTAQKQEENLQNVPLSVSVIPGEVLRRMASRNTSQLAEVIPNLTIQSARPGQSFPVIRGIGTPIEGLGVDQGVAIYVDGVQVDTPVANLISVLELERVEVLRGPQGTLYGRNAVGGVINLISKKPGEEFTGRLRAGVGNYGFWETSLSVEGALVPGVLSGRVGAVYQENSEGFFTNTALQIIDESVADNGTSENATSRAILVYEPGDKLQVTLSADYSMTDASGPAWQPLDDVNALAKASSLQGLVLPVYSESDGDVFALAHNQPTLNDSRIYGGGLTINYVLNDRVELISITGYRKNDLQILEDLDASPYRYLEVVSDSVAENLSQELRFQYADERLDGVIGFFYTDSDYQGLFSVDVAAEFIAAAGGSEPAITERGSESKALAVFSHWDWALTDRLWLTLGGRWSKSEKQSFRNEFVFTDSALSAMAAGIERCFVLSPGVGPDDQPACLTALSIPGQGDVPLPPTVTEAAGDGDWSQFTPKLGARFQVDDQMMVYASYSQGYRDGGFEGVAANFREFGEETLDAYEVGVKSDWADGRLRVNGALFYYDYENVQLELSQLRNNLVVRSVFNAGEARVTGAELESTWLATEWLQIFLDVGWLDTEVTELGTSDPGVDLGFLTTGVELGRAPEWTASFRPVFDFPLMNGSLTWRSEVNYKDGYFRDVANGGFADESDALILTAANIVDGVPPADAVVTPGTKIDSERIDSRVVVNTALSFVSENQRVELTVWARNLFEEEYTIDRDFVNGLGYSYALYGVPRTYGILLSYFF